MNVSDLSARKPSTWSPASIVTCPNSNALNRLCPPTFMVSRDASLAITHSLNIDLPAPQVIILGSLRRAMGPKVKLFQYGGSINRSKGLGNDGFSSVQSVRILETAGQLQEPSAIRIRLEIPSHTWPI